MASVRGHDYLEAINLKKDGLDQIYEHRGADVQGALVNVERGFVMSKDFSRAR